MLLLPVLSTLEPSAPPATARLWTRDAINKAIDAAAAAGGGIVRFPAGSYLCYSIHLKSHITLSLDPGATIVAADAPAEGAGGGYDPPEPNAWDKFQDFGHSHWHNSLIWGEDLQNISIEGQGLIWGKGLSRGDRDAKLPAGVGNKSISLKNCHNVTLRDVSILHGGHFAILATGVDNLTIDNLKIDTNRDAIDVDCCRNVRVSNCSVNSPWDDGICLKDSYGLGFARSTDHVTITNCYVTGGYEEGTMLDATYKPFAPDFKVPRNGRIKFGTESNGGFRNITVSNCVIEKCEESPSSRWTAPYWKTSPSATSPCVTLSTFPSSSAWAAGCAVPRERRWENCGACSSAMWSSPTALPGRPQSSPEFPVTTSKTSGSATFSCCTRAAAPRMTPRFNRRNWRTSILTRTASAQCRPTASTFVM